MAIQVPKPGSRIGMNDPLCAVKSTKNLLNHDYNGMEEYNTEPGKWFESRREHELLNHCKDKDQERNQQDDGVTSERWPLPDDDLKPKQGGPVWTDKKHR
jgi:hypothetical protein